MKKKKKLNALLTSRIMVGLAVIILFVLGLALVAQGFIDTKNYRDQVISVIREHTGKEVEIKGKVSIALLPTPTIYIPAIELRDTQSNVPVPSMTVAMMRLSVAIPTVLSDQPRISGVTLDRPVLEVVRTRSGNIHWDWLNAEVFRALVKSSEPDETFFVQINDGRIQYRDNSTENRLMLENISAYFSSAAHFSGYGSFAFAGHSLRYELSSANTPAPEAESALPFNFRLFTDKSNFMQVDGTMDLSGETPVLQGKTQMEIEDAQVWVRPKTDEKKQLFEQITNQAVSNIQEKARLPLKLAGNWKQEGLDITLDQIQMEGLNSAGTGMMELAWKKSTPVFSVDMDFSAFNYEQWRTLLETAFASTEEVVKSTVYTGEQEENPLKRLFEVRLQLESDLLYYGTQVWHKAMLSATLADAAITVNEFNVQLSGDSTLSLFGIVSQGSTKGMRFEGSMETQGKSLRQMLTVFDESAVNLPETGFGEFYARSNIFVSSEQMRLSEADVKLSDLRLNGGLVAYYDARPRLEADVRLTDIDFDYFRDVWREKQVNANKEEFFLKFDKTMNFDWLNKLQTNIDFKVNVEKFTFLDRAGDHASFRIFAKQGEFGIYDLRFYYPNETTEGSFTLNVSQLQPYVNLILNTNEINTNYFGADAVKPVHVPPPADAKPEPPEAAPPLPLTPAPSDIHAPPPPRVPPEPDPIPVEPPPPPPAPAPAPDSASSPLPSPATASVNTEIVPQTQAVSMDEGVAVPPPRAEVIDDLRKPVRKEEMYGEEGEPKEEPKIWPEELIDMSWMEGFNGSFDISVGKLTHRGVSFDRFKMQARLENNLLTFQNLTFVYWQGRCSILGSMYGGKVPGMSLSYTLFNVEMREMLQSLLGHDNIMGRASVSGTLVTSGVNFRSWVEQSDAKIVMAGRGVLVHGLNLQGVKDAVAISRTAADVYNNVNRALVSGWTTFTVDGNINIKNGILRTPGITVKTEGIIGDVKAEIKLVPWTMDASAFFQFPALTSETIPTMTVQLAGPVATPELRTDTSSLEAYVAKRIISR